MKFINEKKDAVLKKLVNSVSLYDIDYEQAGHDFWLTRCGHGSGFWNRGLGKQGDQLTELCKEFNNVDATVYHTRFKDYSFRVELL